MENKITLTPKDFTQQTLYKFTGTDIFNTIYYKDLGKEYQAINKGEEFYVCSVQQREIDVVEIELLIPSTNSKGVMKLVNNLKGFLKIETK